MGKRKTDIRFPNVLGSILEPTTGFEPATRCLQNRNGEPVPFSVEPAEGSGMVPSGQPMNGREWEREWEARGLE